MQNQEIKDRKYLKFLAEISQDVVPVGRQRLASLIVYKGYPVSIGTNKMKTHPMQAKFGAHKEKNYMHAEIDAIIRALKQLDEKELSRSTLYVCRTKANGSWGMSKPCVCCAEAIRQYGIARVVWTEDETNISSKNFNEFKA